MWRRPRNVAAPERGAPRPGEGLLSLPLRPRHACPPSFLQRNNRPLFSPKCPHPHLEAEQSLPPQPQPLPSPHHPPVPTTSAEGTKGAEEADADKNDDNVGLVEKVATLSSRAASAAAGVVVAEPVIETAAAPPPETNRLRWWISTCWRAEGPAPTVAEARFACTPCETKALSLVVRLVFWAMRSPPPPPLPAPPPPPATPARTPGPPRLILILAPPTADADSAAAG